MASIGEITFNIDGLTIHSTLNIIVQSLSNLPNLPSNLLNRITCQYEQLQIVVIDEISFFGARMFNVINNRLRSIKHIQNKLFGGVDFIVIGDFYQAPLVKDHVNALTSNFWQTYVQCYELYKVMQKSNMVFIQILNKFCTTIENIFNL